MGLWGINMQVYQRRQSGFGGPKGREFFCSQRASGRNCRWKVSLQKNRRCMQGGSVVCCGWQYGIICPQWKWLSFIEDFERCGRDMHVVGGGQPTSILKNRLIIVLGPRIKYNP